MMKFLSKMWEQDPTGFFFFMMFCAPIILGIIIGIPCLTAYRIAELFA